MMKNSCFIIFSILLIYSCKVKKEDSCKFGVDNRNYKLIEGAKYNIVKTHNKDIQIMLDSVMKFNKYKERVITLSYNDYNTNEWNISILQKIEFLDAFDFFSKKGDYVFFYKEEPIFLYSIDDNSIFNRFFSYTINDIIISILAKSYKDIVYFEEPYKQNKELIPAYCQYQFKIIDNKIIDFISNCDSLFFNTKEELEKLYGK